MKKTSGRLMKSLEAFENDAEKHFREKICHEMKKKSME